jgi:hypothetical protein
MAIAFPGPAADLRHVTSPLRSAGRPAGPGDARLHLSERHRKVDLLAIAEGFAVAAPFITELHGLAERRWVLLAVTDLFEAWAIGWPHGGTIEFHDHGPSSGALVVASGTLTETTVRSSARGATVIGTRTLGSGAHRRFIPGYVHDLTNDGEAQAVSVHVYGPRLSTTSYYRLDRRGGLERLRSEPVPPLGPFDATSAHDPS